MLKALLQGVFGAGRIPGSVLPTLQTEGIVFQQEGIWGSITYLNYRAPGRYSNWKRQWFLGSIALTSKRIVAFGWAQRLLDIPYDHPTLSAVTFTLEAPERLCASFDAASFHEDRTGTIELRYATREAAHILELLEQKRGK